jgi:hypothetical protein
MGHPNSTQINGNLFPVNVLKSRPSSSSAQKKGYVWKRTRHFHRGKQDPQQKAIKQADLETLEQWASDGRLELKFLDESGFCLWSPVSYSYSRIGAQKVMEQTPRRGRRLSILGVWQPDETFEYALALGSFRGPSYIKVMDWLADKAAVTPEQNKRDN